MFLNFLLPPKPGEKVAAGRMSDFILHAVRNEAVNSRSRAPALERTALEAPASSDKLARQEPREQCVPRLEPRNKDINSDCVKYTVGFCHPKTQFFHSQFCLSTFVQIRHLVKINSLEIFFLFSGSPQLYRRDNFIRFVKLG